jgi:beta-glucosidase
MTANKFTPRKFVIAIALVVGGLPLLTACGGGGGGGGGSNSSASSAPSQPTLSNRSKGILTVDGLQFRDLDGTGVLKPYADWRLTPEQRGADLVSRMSVAEKAGLMMTDTLNADCGGTLAPAGVDYIKNQNMHRFILRNTVIGSPVCNPALNGDVGAVGLAPQQVSPLEAADFTNLVQQLSEETHWGIPAIFKSNSRNHYDRSALQGVNQSAGAFSEFPKETGLASASLGAGDVSLIKTFTDVMGQEWKAIGLRGMYGYMADMCTEPRWFRCHETFSADADLNSNIYTALVGGLQGGPVNTASAVALTVKHFPGGGPQELGLDPHYSFGKTQVYPSGNFAYHLKPFMAAIKAGVGAVMPYYGVPVNVTYNGVKYDQVGMAFSKQIVTDLLRGQLGFTGLVNSDTGIVNDRAWGYEDLTIPQRVAKAVNSGTDTLSGYHTLKTITDLVKDNDPNGISNARVDEAATRVLLEMFRLGLFENPYVDSSKANKMLGTSDSLAKGLDVQRKSIVMLQNQTMNSGSKALPLKAGANLYVMGMAPTDVTPYGYAVTDGQVKKPDGVTPNVDASGNIIGRPSAAGFDYAVIRVDVTNQNGSLYDSKSTDPAVGGLATNHPTSALEKATGQGLSPILLDPVTGKLMPVGGTAEPYSYADPCNGHASANVYTPPVTCIDNGVIFGGAYPWEVSNISFSTMATSKSWKISPSLADIQAVMNEIGDPKKVVLNISFRQPYVLDAESKVLNAGAINAMFGVSNYALLDVLSSKYKPQGKLPYNLAKTLTAVLNHNTDSKDYPAADVLFPYGTGLSY